MSPRSACSVAGLLAVLACATPSAVRADALESGHFTVQASAVAGDDDGELTFRPGLRAELAFNVLGPLAVGGFLQVVLGDLPSEQPGFGGGLLLTLRPDLPLLGFVPHLELTGGRVQVPSRGQGLVDGWSLGLGGGIGCPVVPGVALEARVHHGWYFGLPQATTLSDRAWTFGAALTIDLP